MPTLAGLFVVMVKQKLQRAEKRVACLENSLENKLFCTSPMTSAALNSKPQPQVGAETVSDTPKKRACMPPTTHVANRQRRGGSEQKQRHSSTHQESRTHQETKTTSNKRNDDLTGMTIHCQISPGSVGKTFNYASQANMGESTIPDARQSKSGRFDENQGLAHKENNIGQTPKSLTMQKARKFGGRKGLQLRLNKIRSPPPAKARALKLR